MGSANAPSHQRGPLLRKSRSGCQDCRLRKVKCDEITPVCSNCRRRYVNIQSCVWSTNACGNGAHSSRKTTPDQPSGEVVIHDALTPNTPAHIHSISLYPSSITSSSQWRTVELRLMYHYTAVVSHTMPGCKGASTDSWQRTIPQLSFESEVVLNPMLALAALHLHAHANNDISTTIALRRYLDRSLVQHLQALSYPSKGQTEQLWLSAVLLSHMYWLLAHQMQPNEAYEFPLHAVKMLQGAGVIFKQNRRFLSQQGYGWIEEETLPAQSLEGNLSMAAQVQLRGIEEDLTYLLDAFDLSTMADDLQSIYNEAKHYVLHHYRAFFSGADTRTLQRFVGFMVVRCQPGYLNLLKQHDPLAMALIARMLVMLSELDHAWWINGKGDYEATERDIRGMRELLPMNIRWVMDWPCNVLDKKILLERTRRSEQV